MKTLTFCAILLVLLSVNALGQATTNKVKIYNGVVKFKDGSPTIRGSFHSFNDSLIYLTSSSKKKDIINSNYALNPAEIENIKVFKVRRKGRVGRSAAIGFGVGAATGIFLGVISGDSDGDDTWNGGYKKTTMSGFFGIPFSLFGTSIGAVTGTRRFPLIKNGTLTSYATHKKSLSDYSMIKGDIYLDEP